MVINALNGVWSDIYIRQIIIHLELEKLAKFLQENLMLAISVKYLLTFSAIESVFVMNLLPKLILFGNFYPREEFLPIASFITDHVIFISFLYFIIKFR